MPHGEAYFEIAKKFAEKKTHVCIYIYITLICCMYETILKLNGKALQCNWPYSQVLGVSGYRKATSFTASVHHSAAVTFCFFDRDSATLPTAPDRCDRISGDTPQGCAMCPQQVDLS